MSPERAPLSPPSCLYFWKDIGYNNVHFNADTRRRNPFQQKLVIHRWKNL